MICLAPAESSLRVCTEPDGKASGPSCAKIRSTGHLKNFFAAIWVQAITSVVPIATLILMARNYDLADFGRYSVALAFVNVATIFFSFGIANSVCFQIAAMTKERDRHDGILMSGLLLYMAVSLLFAPAFIISANYLIGYDRQTIQLIVILGAGYWCTTLLDLMNSVFRGKRQMHWALISISVSAIAGLATTTPHLLIQAPLHTVAVTWAISQILGPLLAIVCLLRNGYLQSVSTVCEEFKTVMNRSFAIGIDGVIFRIGTQLVVLTLPILLSVRDAGTFSAASKPFALLVMGNQFTMQFFGPYIAAVSRSDNIALSHRIQLCHKISFFFTASIIMSALVFPAQICNLLYAENSEEIYPLMRLLAIAHVIYYTPPYASSIKAMGLERQVVWCGVAQWAVMMLMLAVIVPFFGVWGSGCAILIAYSAYWLVELAIYRLNKLTAIENFTRYLLFISATAAIGFTITATSSNTTTLIVFGVAACAVSLLVYWTPEEILKVRTILRTSLLSLRS